MDLHRRVLLYQFSWATSQRKVENDKLNPSAPIREKLLNFENYKPDFEIHRRDRVKLIFKNHHL